MNLHLTWDATAALGLLHELQDPALAGRIAKHAAEAYTDSILDWIAMGNSFRGRTGQLEQSIGWRPDGVVYANAEYAPYLEFGTGTHGPKAQAYEIKPKAGRKALRWPIGGAQFGPPRGYGMAKKIIHPGIKAQPYFFADFEARESTLLDAALGVLATTLDRRS